MQLATDGWGQTQVCYVSLLGRYQLKHFPGSVGNNELVVQREIICVSSQGYQTLIQERERAERERRERERERERETSSTTGDCGPQEDSTMRGQGVVCVCVSVCERVCVHVSVCVCVCVCV